MLEGECILLCVNIHLTDLLFLERVVPLSLSVTPSHKNLNSELMEVRDANGPRALVSPGIQVPNGGGQQRHTIARLFRVEGLGFRH
jgi:hypothetical protein